MVKSIDIYFNRFFKNLDYSVLVVGLDGKIKLISTRFLERLGYSIEQVRKMPLQDVISEPLYREIFENGVAVREPFKNYLTLIGTAGDHQVPFQISGCLEEDRENGEKNLCFLLQELSFEVEPDFSGGFFEERVKTLHVLQKYVTKQLFDRAMHSVRTGIDYIPAENRVLTFLFADLVAFTMHAEKISPEEVVEMLNLSIGATSATILHSGGYVDKIMGDSIFAVFEKPENAVIAAIEIQKQFNLLNFFRIKDGLDEVLLRIGIHTGESMWASIGSQDFMEQTFIGDAVNTASRLENSAIPGSILVSSTTVEPIRDKLQLLEKVELTVKGKEEKLIAYYVNRINFERRGQQASLGLDDDLF